MARINTNVPSLIARNNLGRSNGDLAVRLQRLSTGLRINRGADDPAGLIVSERLRSEMKGLDQAIDNSERASSVIATAEGYLAEVADLLNSVKGLVVEAANTGGVSQEEIEANQLQIDSAIESITRISNTASFAGLQLLNGNLDYTTSGVNAANITGVQVDGAQLGTDGDLSVDVEVVQSAQTGTLFIDGSTGTVGVLDDAVTVEVAGTLGVQSVSFASGTALSTVATAINTLTGNTGVSASFVTSGIQMNSTDYGSESFVSVKQIGTTSTDFSVLDAAGGTETQRDEGQNVSAVVNGVLAVGDGLDLSLKSPSLTLDLDLSEGFATTVDGTVSSFNITGGGANFQLGPSISNAQAVGVGIQSVAATRIGGTDVEGIRFFLDSVTSGKDNSLLSGNASEASDILDNAITEISVMRGRLGAFERNTLQTNVRSLQIGLENITASESKIRDADFAAETANLTRAQILNQAGTSVLATANASAQSVLALLQ
ncbi:MAG: flagellin [Phycisphaerae bacterium]|nr:flagellin [Phycisphaerae bacterium]